ncbi:MAG: oligopeptide/dipeptide ABC transporter ATP-binding protein [Pseudomonadota bacterium]|nr:oligopeptide/dipeptide ABC transporter ATP-binding protein [Pseudomonadota bacterium]
MTLLRLEAVTKEFPLTGSLLEELQIIDGRLRRVRPRVHAVNGVSLTLEAGETLGVVGESGCGKSTLARLVAGLIEPTQGTVALAAPTAAGSGPATGRNSRHRVQMVFQNPQASLSPRMRIGAALDEPLRVHYPGLSAPERAEKVQELMAAVGLNPSWTRRFPHELSGGQRQRVSIARALTPDPDLIVADEPVSALDVSVQAQVLNLMVALRESRGIAYLFITHDLAVVRHIAQRVAVMYLGVVCELTTPEQLFTRPRHPYSQALLESVPRLDGKRGSRQPLAGPMPAATELPSGCLFHTRCPHRRPQCTAQRPKLLATSGDGHVACHGVAEGWLPH